MKSLGIRINSGSPWSFGRLPFYIVEAVEYDENVIANEVKQFMVEYNQTPGGLLRHYIDSIEYDENVIANEVKQSMVEYNQTPGGLLRHYIHRDNSIILDSRLILR